MSSKLDCQMNGQQTQQQQQHQNQEIQTKAAESDQVAVSLLGAEEQEPFVATDKLDKDALTSCAPQAPLTNVATLSAPQPQVLAELQQISGGQVSASKQPECVGKTKIRVLDPSGSLYYHWSMVVSFAFLYNFWSLSYRFAFQEIDFDTVAFWFALDYSADFIYLLDVVINFHTGYLEDGVLQRQADKIGQHYRECTLFYLDCFCLLPLDILYLSIGFNSILRCTRLVKIYKFWSYVDRTERHTNYPNVFRTFTLVHYILVIFHWNACLFHMISKNKLIDIENLYKINDNRCEDILCQYLHAFYWSTLALTTIGDLPKPRTKGEYVYVTAELFFGLFLFASVLGHVANIVTNVSAARKEFQAKLDAVKTFMRMRRVSDDLQNKVIRWFDYLWISQKSSDEERSVACLPDRLKAEIAIHVHLDTLKRVDIFQNTEAGFLCELVLRLKPVLFSPGDYVCRKNEVGHEMYIVSRGILEVVANEGQTVVATLKAGSYFGEISVLNVGLAGNKRTASVRSVGYSDLFCLNKQDLWDVLRNYPNAEARIRARAEERLSKLDINHQSVVKKGQLFANNSVNLAKDTCRQRAGSSGSRYKSLASRYARHALPACEQIYCSCHLLASRGQQRLHYHHQMQQQQPIRQTCRAAKSFGCHGQACVLAAPPLSDLNRTKMGHSHSLEQCQEHDREEQQQPSGDPCGGSRHMSGADNQLTGQQLDAESSFDADSNGGRLSGGANDSSASDNNAGRKQRQPVALDRGLAAGQVSPVAADRGQQVARTSPDLRLNQQNKSERLSTDSMEVTCNCGQQQTSPVSRHRRRRRRCDGYYACSQHQFNNFWA